MLVQDWQKDKYSTLLIKYLPWESWWSYLNPAMFCPGSMNSGQSWSFRFIYIGEIIDHHNVSFFHYFQIRDKLHETIISIFLLFKRLPFICLTRPGCGLCRVKNEFWLRAPNLDPPWVEGRCFLNVSIEPKYPSCTGPGRVISSPLVGRNTSDWLILQKEYNENDKRFIWIKHSQLKSTRHLVRTLAYDNQIRYFTVRIISRNTVKGRHLLHLIKIFCLTVN